MNDDFENWLSEREKEAPSDDGSMLRPGQRIGAYRIVRQLGVGGMGQVYEAEHVALGVRRALKVFSTESAHSEFLRKRFVAEGRILADLQHPRIVRVYDLVVDEDSGTAYFEMDLVLSPDGQPRTLADELQDGPDEERIVGWFKDICEGLAYIHSQGVVHRDISLDNILIGRDGRAVITDFGIAKIIDDSYRKKIDVTVTMVYKDGSEVRIGKERYMAPELKKPNGRASFATDAWALGVLLFRMLSGSWYDVGTRLEDWHADLKYDWHPLLSQLFNPEPENRLGTGGIASLPTLLRRRACSVTSWRRKWMVACGIVVVLSVVAIGVSRLIWKGDSSNPPAEEEVQRPVEEILKGADSGRTEDMVLAAEMYRDGKGVETDYTKSVELYRKAIGQGSFDAVGGIGSMYEHGWGVTNNLHAAYLMYLVAAANGVSNSVPDIIRCYENGIGVAKNSQEARRWLRRKVVKPVGDKVEGEWIVEDKIRQMGDELAEFAERLNSSKWTRIGGVAYRYGVMTNGAIRIFCVGEREEFKSKGANPQLATRHALESFEHERSVNGALTIPDAIESRPVEEIAFYALFKATNLVSVVLPSSVKVIKGAAFKGCESLSKVSLPEGLLEVGDHAFYGCEKLHDVVLPCSVTNIGGAAFYPVPPIIPDNHPHFSFRDGALYSKDMSTLFAYYGSSNSFCVATNTKHIARGAFAYARSLENVSLPGWLETIGDHAFWNCAALRSLIIPEAVTNIGSYAFAHCTRLKTICYQGQIPHVEDNIYDGVRCVFSFVRKGRGWEDASGSLPQQWPRQARVDTDWLPQGDCGGKGCYLVQYWENLSSERMIEIQVERLRSEAVRGNVAAMKELAGRYMHGKGGRVKDSDEAIKYLEGAANGGNDGEAMCEIADFYCKGAKGERSCPEAVRWYRNALEGGGEWSMRACQQLANLYWNGLGVEKDTETAFMLTLIAAAHKMSGAQCALADCYEKGVVVETNLVEAARWDREAERTCRSGHELGLWYKYGGGVVDTDPKKAFRWFMYGVKQGNGVSAVEIAGCYKTGYGVEKDLSKVYEYSMVGARKGWSCGMRSVAECFENGWGVETNLAKAAEWYIKAAEADTDYWDGGAALIKAGDCYAEGRGVERDSTKARAWYQKAVDRRHSDSAKRKIDDLDQKMQKEEFDYVFMTDKATGAKSVAIVRVRKREKGNCTIPASIDGYNVTCIKDEAFLFCDITTVTIPASVTNISDSAFTGCLLNAFQVAEDNPAYKSVLGHLLTKDGKTLILCGAKRNAVIPDGVVNVRDGALRGGILHTEVTIPASVTNILASAFVRCHRLSKIVVAADNPAYKSVSGFLLTKDGRTLVAGLDGDVKIPDGVRHVGDGAFYCRIPLSSVEMPASITSIGKRAFYNCWGLRRVTIPDGVTRIEEGAFSFCDYLTYVKMSDSVTHIGGRAFFRCSRLTSVEIPVSVVSVGEEAFGDCKWLKSVTIAGNVRSIGKGAFPSVPLTVYVAHGDTERVKKLFVDSGHDISNIEFVEREADEL